MNMQSDLQRILVSGDQIAMRVKELGQEITRDYENTDEITIVSIINGAILFTADLIRSIDRRVCLDCIRVSSYLDQTTPATKPQVLENLRVEISNRHLLVIDDILDTGRTLSHIINLFQRRHPASLRICVLLEKPGRRETDVRADYVGFQIPDEFVVGYGLDFAERYRNLPCIGVLKPEFQNPPAFL